MNLKEAMAARHSVRQYKNKPLTPEIIAALQAEVEACNRDGGLHIQLVTNEPKAFDSLDEKCGYYGERLVLKAQQLGLNTCWVAMTYSKGKAVFSTAPGEKLCIVIALGYGENQGIAHKSKPFEKIASAEGQIPSWFRSGAEAALLAPTAMNQQKFKFELHGSQVTAKAGLGFYSKIDLGIAKYHFEIGAGKENFTWA